MKSAYIHILFLISSMSFAMEKDEKQKSAWTEKYHKTSQMQFQFAQSQLPTINLAGHEVVLDIGCGTGRTTHFIAQYLPNGSIVGVDSSEDMIEFARREYGIENNVLFQVADAAQLQFDQFDRVISFFCLQWLKEKEKALDGIARALKHGGRAHIFVPVASKDYEIGLNCIHETLKKHPEWKQFCTIPNNEWAEMWIERAQQSGLSVVSQNTIPKTSTYASKKEWNEYCSNLGITTLQGNEREQFIAEVNDLLYIKYNLSDNDPYVRTTNILALELIKD